MRYAWLITTQEVDQTVSQFYLASEIGATMTDLAIAVPEHELAPLAHATTEQFVGYLLLLARYVDLNKLRKTPRGLKKPPTPRTKYKGHPHVSTAKLLAGAGPDT